MVSYTDNLNFLGLFDRNVDFITKFAMVKVSENVEEDEPLPQTLVNMTHTKNKARVECVTKSSRLISLTNQLKILHRAASKVFSGCLASIFILLLLIETQLSLLKITLKHQALSCFEMCSAPSPRKPI